MNKEKYVVHNQETAVVIVNTRVDAVKKKDIMKTGLRLYHDGHIGIAGAIGAYDEAALDERARKHLRFQIPYPHEPSGNHEEHCILKADLPGNDRLVDEVGVILEELRTHHPDFGFANNVMISEKTVELTNDLNLRLSYKDRSLIFTVLVKEKTSSNIADAIIVTEDREYNRKTCLERFHQFCRAYQNPVSLPDKKKLPVFFRASDSQPLQKFLEVLNGRNFGAGSSLLSEKQGKKVFNPNFTLYQSLNPEEDFIPFFDAEGTSHSGYRYPLIEEGVVVTPYTDKKTAGIYGYPLTGSASCGYDEVPTLGGPRLVVKRTEQTIRELLGGEAGIYVNMAMGGEFTADGKFSTPVQCAFLYDGEKLLGRLPEIFLSSDLFTMYGEAFRGVSSDRCDPLSGEHLMVLEMEVGKIG